MSEEKTYITSFNHRHERIKSIANELDTYLERQFDALSGNRAPYNQKELRKLHQLRGYCEQLRVDAESLKNGADGFGKGTRELEEGRA